MEKQEAGPVYLSRGLCVRAGIRAAVLAVTFGCSSSTAPDKAAAPAARAATLEPVSGILLEGTVRHAVDPSPAVRARDSGGHAMREVPVTFHVLSGAGTLVQSLVLTDADGIAASTWVLGAASGIQELTATTPGTEVVTFTANAAPGPVARIAQLGVTDRLGGAGSNLGSLSFRVTDSLDNPIAGVTVVFEVTSGMVEYNSAVTGTNGAAAAGTWTLGPGLNAVVGRASDLQSAPVLAFGRSPNSALYVVQSIDGRAAPPWFGAIVLESDGSFFAESRLGTGPTFWGTGNYRTSGTGIILDSDTGNWLEWATEPGTMQSARGSVTPQELRLTWFVSGPDYDTFWIYRLAP